MADLDFFSSPIGLGHATRDIAIAENFGDISARFVTGNGAARLLRRTGFDVEDLYRPPRFIVEDGSLKNSAKWLWRYYRYYQECKHIADKIIRTCSPKIVVSDEDFASLAVAQEMKIPTILITDVLETHFTRGIAALVEKKMNRAMRDIIKRCDVVIVPEHGEDQDNIRRVGPIIRQTRFSREELRKKFSFDKKTILVSVGGTDAGAFLIERVLDAISKVDHDVDMVIVSGPSLKRKAGRVRDLGFVDNLHEFIFAADVLVSLAGKSTIDEAHAYGTPGIFIPIKGHFEQEDNAREEGFSFGDVNRLEELISEKLDQNRGNVTYRTAETASQIITDML